MKTSIKPAILLLSIVFLLTSCFKEKHSIRFENNFTEQFNSITIGPADIGNVAPGGTSDYKAVPTGVLVVKGTSPSGGKLSGSISLSGKGKHKWTVTINSNADISIKENK